MVQMETPPLLRGTEQEQLAQLRSYLFQAAQHLNLALNDLSMDSFGKDVQEAIQAGGTQSAEKVQTSVDQTASALKDLIIKTANVIYQQMDVLETVLRISGSIRRRSRADLPRRRRTPRRPMTTPPKYPPTPTHV